ncbi:hypothetical protein NPA08_04660 [Mycoplasmopsis citelli]|uniref:hypothetical protein n=1 Tax=Mycoplasmopsis citelli TaxID=171281 RepID=UPI002113B93F|nr:hypothetical protein [Mycoplasmopsis citelli]UUD36212.1 hypothetical protein NPA08_04660 [Mycoplasmopsis citelli]
MSTYILFRRQFISLWNQKFRFLFSFFVPIFIFTVLLLILDFVAVKRVSKSILTATNFQVGTGLLFLITIINGATLTVIQIQDNFNNAVNDIKITPIKHWKIRYSYFLFNFLINFITTVFIYLIFIVITLAFDATELESFNRNNQNLKSIASETIDLVASLIKYIKQIPELSAQYGNNADEILKNLENIYTSASNEATKALFDAQTINVLNLSTMSFTLLLTISSSLFASLFFPIVLSRLKSINIWQAINVVLILFGGYFIGTFIHLYYYPGWLRAFCSIIPTTHLLQIARHSLYAGTVGEATNLSLNPISLFNQNISVSWSLIYVLFWIAFLFWINIFLDKLISMWNIFKYHLKENYGKFVKKSTYWFKK